MAPSTTKQWTVEGPTGFDGLKWNDKAEIPALGDHDVLVNFHYASLNYRDLIISLVPIPLPLLPIQTLAHTCSSKGQISLPHWPTPSPCLGRRRHRRRHGLTRLTLPKRRSSRHALQPIPPRRRHHRRRRRYRSRRQYRRHSPPIRRL